MSELQRRRRRLAQKAPSKEGRWLVIFAIIAGILGYLMIMQPWRDAGQLTDTGKKVLSKTEKVKPPPKPHFQRFWKIDGLDVSLKIVHPEPDTFNTFADEWVKAIKARRLDLEPEGDGALGRLNREAKKGPYKPEAWLWDVLMTVKNVSERTNGRVDPTLGYVLKVWNLDSGKEEILPPTQLKDSLKQARWSRTDVDKEAGTIHFKREAMILDLWPVYEGVLAKRARSMIEEKGLENWAFNIGNVAVVLGEGPEGPWSIELEHPRKTRVGFAKVLLNSGTTATWDDTKTFFMDRGFRYHKILDPITGVPSQLSWSTTAVHQDPIKAQAYAYAMFIFGGRRGADWANDNLDWLPVVWVTRSGEYFITKPMKTFLVREDFDMGKVGMIQ